MKFSGRYTNQEKAEAGKTKLSNDAYALGEMIEELIDKIEHARTSLQARR